MTTIEAIEAAIVMLATITSGKVYSRAECSQCLDSLKAVRDEYRQAEGQDARRRRQICALSALVRRKTDY
jgi:hypothetical protein